jgi:uncharacterized protein YebE (UPF0316 family)
MDILLSSQAWLSAGLIFLLRLVNMSLDTLRVLMVTRGRKGLAWVFGFLQTVVFVIVFIYVIQDLNNWLNIVAYAAGFATGNVFGMWIEERIALGHVDLRIISPNWGAAIAERLREDGYAVTEIPARGRDGMVTLLNCSVRRKDLEMVEETIQEIDPKAFVTAEDVRPIQRGFWRLKK